ncbi:hypothetical protein B0H65DRAFT_79780 [Neurospora tetraspora]|uniref:Uncharacterized protein n=1 Tax=Neurospora tetraspora TaxID=94610 RepID=A0AAE0MKD7_9PEZI|nr:hypothetical protein B0H65DRAFT_79780 [Neurospora tetraspora]
MSLPPTSSSTPLLLQHPLRPPSFSSSVFLLPVALSILDIVTAFAGLSVQSPLSLQFSTLGQSNRKSPTISWPLPLPFTSCLVALFLSSFLFAFPILFAMYQYSHELHHIIRRPMNFGQLALGPGCPRAGFCDIHDPLIWAGRNVKKSRAAVFFLSFFSLP